jgi:sialate O-acetylesterase
VVAGDSIRVASAGVAAPVAVRYGWLADPEQATLVNGEGLPAGPFRSDDWPLP